MSTPSSILPWGDGVGRSPYLTRPILQCLSVLEGFTLRKKGDQEEVPLQDPRQRGSSNFPNLDIILLLNQILSNAEKLGVLATAQRYGDQGMDEPMGGFYF